MREIFTYGSVGRAPRKRCLYPELDRVIYAGLRKIRCSSNDILATSQLHVDTCYLSKSKVVLIL